MSYFKGFSTVESIKAEYRRLAMINHPDHGGQTATMQEINAQYHEALKSVNGTVNVDETGRSHTYNYNATMEQEIMDKISQLVSAGVAKQAEILLIGVWVWITGDTKPIKEVLKAAGCRWHSKRMCWYWQNTGYSGHSRADLGSLAAKYGATQFRDRETMQLA